MAVNDVVMTMDQAKAMLTPAGRQFDSLEDAELNTIITLDKASRQQKQAAGMIMMERHAKKKESDEAAKLKAKTDSVPQAPPEVTPTTAFPPAPKIVPDGIVATYLLEITQKLDRLASLVGVLSKNTSENSEAIGLITGYLRQFSESSNKESAPASRTPTPDHLPAGGKPLKQEHATRFVLEHKDGKVRVSFWDDDKPKLKFAVLTNTMSAQDWAKMIPWVNVQAWKPASVLEWATAFPNAKKQNEIEFRCNLFYTDSDNLTANGNPYKDLQRVQPDDF